MCSSAAAGARLRWRAGRARSGRRLPELVLEASVSRAARRSWNILRKICDHDHSDSSASSSHDGLHDDARMDDQRDERQVGMDVQACSSRSFASRCRESRAGRQRRRVDAGERDARRGEQLVARARTSCASDEARARRGRRASTRDLERVVRAARAAGNRSRRDGRRTRRRARASSAASVEAERGAAIRCARAR